MSTTARSPASSWHGLRRSRGADGCARSLANSAAIFGYPAMRRPTGCGPGLALYGVSPFPDQAGSSLGTDRRHAAGVHRDRGAR